MHVVSPLVERALRDAWRFPRPFWTLVAPETGREYAVGFHRHRRATRSFGSIFDELQGVGPARRRAILQHFGSAERFLAATQEELEGVPGVPAKTARAIYAQLHKAGRA